MFRKFLAPKATDITVDPSNAEAEKTIEKALLKLDLTLVDKIKKRAPEVPEYTLMLFRKE